MSKSFQPQKQILLSPQFPHMTDEDKSGVSFSFCYKYVLCSYPGPSCVHVALARDWHSVCPENNHAQEQVAAVVV